MATLHDAMVYLANRYPHRGDLSNARLTKMIYLADWRAAIRQGQQITAIEWPFNHFGPFTNEVIDEARRSNDFEVISTETVYGSPKQVIQLAKPNQDAKVEPWEAEALDHVLRTTSDLSWAKFIELIYSTYPVVSQSRYTTLNLVELARDYSDLKQAIPSQA